MKPQRIERAIRTFARQYFSACDSMAYAAPEVIPYHRQRIYSAIASLLTELDVELDPALLDEWTLEIDDA